ncbi:MAG: DNA photolyase [bacterium]|nr:DNA photolyase [bacterium]
MLRPPLHRIVIDPEVRDSPIAAAVRRHAAGVEVTEEPTAPFAAATRHLTRAEGKRLLLVRPFHGRSFKPCQGGRPEYSCCGLHTLADANGCGMECSYCILQYYMTSPHLTVFGNVDDLLEELAQSVAAEPEKLFRVSTGELGDSLLLDPLTEMSRHLVPFFRDLPNAVLELKTKSDHVANLLELDHAEKTVISWSVNPPQVVAHEELKTASLDARLAAAREVAARGYPVAFHFDPIVHVEGWRDEYAGVVKRLVDAVEPERWAWLSMGTLRFLPEMKETMEGRFPRSRLPHGDLIRGNDGKLRYPRPLRVEMYRWIVDELRRLGVRREEGPVVYLCMETPDVWKKVFGGSPPTREELDRRFSASYRRRFARGSWNGAAGRIACFDGVGT